jgi:hypothetical protein
MSLNRTVILQQALLFIHVVAYALTLSAVLRGDWRLLATRRLDAPRLVRTGRAVSIGLSALYGAVVAVSATPARGAPHTVQRHGL